MDIRECLVVELPLESPLFFEIVGIRLVELPLGTSSSGTTPPRVPQRSVVAARASTRCQMSTALDCGSSDEEAAAHPSVERFWLDARQGSSRPWGSSGEIVGNRVGYVLR